MSKPISIFIIALFSALSWNITANAQSRPCPEPVRSAFRYVITNNDEITSTQGETLRIIDVLMDATSLSEGNLRKLFASLSNKFSGSSRLLVRVHTNLEDVYTPEEASQIVHASKCDTLRGDRYPWAMYNRSAAYEGFDYVQKIGDKISTVQLRSRS